LVQQHFSQITSLSKLTEETKRCPYCGEVILAIAIRCKHCSMMLDGSNVAAPGGGAGGATPLPNQPAWAMGSQIATGTKIREYRFEALLGKGGMGEVYRATHEFTQQTVAIKVLYTELVRNESSSRRFVEEGRVMAGLSHPNIVQFVNFFEECDRYFLVMEFVDGETLDDLLERRPLSLKEALGIAKGVLAALDYAHALAQPVIHRDIKPANIMLSNDGRVVVADFGIAKAVGRERLTRTQGVVGTYEYMSPEQVRGEEVSPATDIYAFGITLYKMLTGVVPFPQQSDTGIDCMNAHLSSPVPSIAEFREGLPAWLQPLLGRALAKSVTERFSRANDMKQALMSASTDSPEAKGRQPVVTAAPQKSTATPPSRPTAPATIRTPPSTGNRGRSSVAGSSQPVPTAQELLSDVQRLSNRRRWLGAIVVAFLAAALIFAMKSGSAGPEIEWVYSKPAGLYFAKTETTLSQYEACVDAGGCDSEHHLIRSDHISCNWGYADRADHPMNCVNWHGADQFCQWAGGRLPTKSEWYAEASNDASRVYAWGNREVTSNLAIWGDTTNWRAGKESTWPVCSKVAGNSVSGLCDISGNVWEWTSSPYGSGRNELVLRGGGWREGDRQDLQASKLVKYQSDDWMVDGGFRCVRSSQP
jgi:serine/threonine protein kinase